MLARTTRKSLLAALVLVLAACRATPGSGEATAQDAGRALVALTGPITLAYASEISDLCYLFPIGPLTEKVSPQTDGT